MSRNVFFIPPGFFFAPTAASPSHFARLLLSFERLHLAPCISDASPFPTFELSLTAALVSLPPLGDLAVWCALKKKKLCFFPPFAKPVSLDSMKHLPL